MRPDELLLIDGNYLQARCIFKKGVPLANRKGEVTKGTLFFVQSLFKLLRERNPAYCAIAYDAPRATYKRREWFADYKAARENRPSDPQISQQFKRCRQIVKALGLTTFELEGWEGDDIIATLATECASEEVHATIVSIDKDMLQLVNPWVRMYDDSNKEYQDEAYCRRRWSVEPEQMVDLQALMGDSSDSIPGVAGIGPGNALKILKRVGSIESLMRRGVKAAGLNPKTVMYGSLEKAMKDGTLTLMKKLVTLKTDLDVPYTPEMLEFDGVNMAGARPIFRELGFSRWS